jgi:hypothetical protein
VIDRPNIETWDEYRRLVLAELERISIAVVTVNDKLDRFHSEEISKLKIDVAMLQVKASLWGAGAGLLVAIGAALLKIVIGK